MKKETPETDALGREIGKILARQLPIRNTAGMIQRELDDRCGKLERERDEKDKALGIWIRRASDAASEFEKLWHALGCNTASLERCVEVVESLFAERDQLRKEVLDWKQGSDAEARAGDEARAELKRLRKC